MSMPAQELDCRVRERLREATRVSRMGLAATRSGLSKATGEWRVVWRLPEAWHSGRAGPLMRPCTWVHVRNGKRNTREKKGRKQLRDDNCAAERPRVRLSPANGNALRCRVSISAGDFQGCE